MLLALTGTVFSLASTAIAEVQIHNINKHLKENEEEITKVKNNLNTLLSTVIEMGENTMSLIRNLKSDFEEGLEDLECELYFTEAINWLRLEIEKYKRDFDIILLETIGGKNMRVNPTLLDPKNLIEMTGNLTTQYIRKILDCYMQWANRG